MRILLSLAVLAILGPVVALVYANGWANIGRDGPLLPRDEDLMEVSPFLALMQSAQRFRYESSCATADFLTTTVIENESDEANAFLEKFVAGIRGECYVFGLSTRSTGPVFQTIKDSGVVPETAYVFSLFVYDPNIEGGPAGYAEETVGLFADRESCDRVEHAARELNLPTRRCVPWNGRDLL